MTGRNIHWVNQYKVVLVIFYTLSLLFIQLIFKFPSCDSRSLREDIDLNTCENFNTTIFLFNPPFSDILATSLQVSNT